ncbi:MAG: RIP metalloprotease RseP [Verrucomicrobiota bacterium]|nr:RIP metalloprotease RseP [Verrucomicrobiota bacterium]
MPIDLLHALATHVWTWLLIVLFFGGSIFVHELGHFLVARWRGMHVERFSIGFGPKIFSWRRGGVEYRLSWLPLGGYVLLPQLAEIGLIEGTSATDVSKLPPVTYKTKFLVSAAGAAFNVIFAFVLACIVWIVGQPMGSDMASTRIGYIAQTIELSDHTKAPGPAAQAGLRIGDNILAIDGHKVNDWSDVQNSLILGGGHSASGQRMVIFTIARDGHTFDLPVYPRLSGQDRLRRVGIAPAYKTIVHSVTPGSPAQRIGLKPNDQILGLDATPVLNPATLQDYLTTHFGRAVTLKVRRDKTDLALTLPPRPNTKNPADLGFDFTTDFRITHPNPFAQVAYVVNVTARSLWSLLNPYSDIGLSKLSGPVRIVQFYHSAVEAGFPAVLIFTILINVNLAIINLLPIPVLDGGHILFATINKLRGRALPINIVAATQSVFLVLLLSMILYVSFYDIRRWARDIEDDRKANAPPPAPAPVKP